MSEIDMIGTFAVDELKKRYKVTQLDIGSDAKLSKNGMRFITKCYEIEGFGHLCIMTMNAMLGLVKMETVVLSAADKDAPLLNLDWIKAMGKETFMAELYDCQLSPLPEELMAAYASLKENDEDIPEYISGPHWYDEIKYPFSYGKSGKGYGDRFKDAAKAYLGEYMRQLPLLSDCDPQVKKEKIDVFAGALLRNGGPAVDQVKKLFGEETAGRLIKTHMYGV